MVNPKASGDEQEGNDFYRPACFLGRLREIESEAPVLKGGASREDNFLLEVVRISAVLNDRARGAHPGQLNAVAFNPRPLSHSQCGTRAISRGKNRRKSINF
jgi:hypothetical protein